APPYCLSWCALTLPARARRALVLLDLQEIELDRCFTAKERHQHRHLVALGSHFADGADELREGAVDDLDGLSELEQDLGLGLGHGPLALGRRLQDVAQLALLWRHRRRDRRPARGKERRARAAWLA